MDMEMILLPLMIFRTLNGCSSVIARPIAFKYFFSCIKLASFCSLKEKENNVSWILYFDVGGAKQTIRNLLFHYKQFQYFNWKNFIAELVVRTLLLYLSTFVVYLAALLPWHPVILVTGMISVSEIRYHT